MNLKNNTFDLIDTISNDGSEIETLFIERISQLVKPYGIAAVILPTTILTKNITSYIFARKILLSNFKIRGITCFGEKTFGATSTSTVTIFLQKFDEPPSKKSLVEDSVENLLSGENVDIDTEDYVILEEFLKKIEVDKNTFNEFVNEKKDLKYWQNKSFFDNYYNDFISSKEYNNKIKQKNFKKLNENEKKELIAKMFYLRTKELVGQKLYVFSFVYNQKTIVVSAPEDNKEQKKFLGYEWSRRKGFEGISIFAPGGKLYNENDRNDDDTIAGIIRNSFDDEYYDIPNKVDYYHRVNLKDMIDFSRTIFNLEINTNIKEEIKYRVNIKTELLANLIYEQPKSKIQVNEAEENYSGQYPFFTSGESVYKYDSSLVNGENIYMATGGVATIKFYNGEAAYSTDTWVIKSCDENKIKTKLLFYILESLKFVIKKDYFKGQGLKHLQKDDLKLSIKMPLLDETVQKEIIEKCENIDKQYSKKYAEIDNINEEIKKLYISTKLFENKKINLGDNTNFNISIGKRVLMKNIVDDGIPVISANVNQIFGYIEDEILNDYTMPSIIWGLDGDWMVNYVVENHKFYPTDHCGVMRINSNEINPLYFMFKLEELGKNEGFNRTNRPSMDRIKSLSCYIPDIKIQNDFADKVSKLKMKVTLINKNINQAFEDKKNILDSYLK